MAPYGTKLRHILCGLMWRLVEKIICATLSSFAKLAARVFNVAQKRRFFWPHCANFNHISPDFEKSFCGSLCRNVSQCGARIFILAPHFATSSYKMLFKMWRNVAEKKYFFLATLNHLKPSGRKWNNTE